MFYTLAPWRVRKGNEDEFVRIWRDELAASFLAAASEATGTLIRSLDDPQLFYSFGPWESLEAMQKARNDPAVGSAIAKLIALCNEAKPGAFRVVLEIGPPAM